MAEHRSPNIKSLISKFDKRTKSSLETEITETQSNTIEEAFAAEIAETFAAAKNVIGNNDENIISKADNDNDDNNDNNDDKNSDNVDITEIDGVNVVSRRDESVHSYILSYNSKSVTMNIINYSTSNKVMTSTSRVYIRICNSLIKFSELINLQTVTEHDGEDNNDKDNNNDNTDKCEKSLIIMLNSGKLVAVNNCDMFFFQIILDMLNKMTNDDGTLVSF